MINKEDLFPLSHSALSKFEQSPLHYLHYKMRKDVSTPAMEFGKAYHKCILEPEKFENQYIVQPKFDLRTKVGIAGYAEFLEANPNRAFISESDMNKLKAMKVALYDCKPAKYLIDQVGETEKLVEWTDEVTLVRLKAFIDAIGEKIALDLKTCQDATPRLFNSTIFNYGYHRQGALYTDGLKAQRKKNANKKFYFIAQEKDEPYGCSVHYMPPEVIEVGRVAYNKLILDFLKWAQTLESVGYEHWSETGQFEVTIPKWMRYGS